MEATSKLMNDGKGRSSSIPPDSESLSGFVATVRPFHRLVYLVAFACTKSQSVAEHVAVNAMAHAFKQCGQRAQCVDEFKVYLIRTVILEARAHVEVNSTPDNLPEDIDDLLAQRGINEWRPIALDALTSNDMRSNFTTALWELSTPTAVILLLRDAFHLTTLQIAELTGESHQKVQARLAYARIAACMKLAKCASNHEIPSSATVAAAY
jgi:DNA-directed RNA polymerase specialized sigma24 family protein